MPAEPLHGGPQDHVWFQEPFQEVLARPGDPQVPRQGDAFLLLAQHLRDVGVVEGQLGAQQDVEDDAQTPDVALAAVVGHSLQHFGCRVGHAAAEGAAQLPAAHRELLGEAEVRQLHGAALQQRVLALEVAVSHPAAVAVLDGLDQLAEERPGAVLRQRALVCHVVKDVPVLGQLHHEVDLPVCRLQHLVHVDDVLVVQALDDLELPGQEFLNELCQEEENWLSVPEPLPPSTPGCSHGVGRRGGSCRGSPAPRRILVRMDLSAAAFGRPCSWRRRLNPAGSQPGCSALPSTLTFPVCSMVESLGN